MYKITIQKQVKNSNYENELKAYTQRNEYGYSIGVVRPQEYFLEDCLTTELEEDEWIAVKKAIIECK